MISVMYCGSDRNIRPSDTYALDENAGKYNILQSKSSVLVLTPLL